MDLVIPNASSATVGVMLANGGGLDPQVQMPTQSGTCSADVADLDGDLINDIVVTNYFANTMSVLLGLGGGTFAAPVTSASSGVQPSYTAIADLDGDTHADLAIANKWQDIVTVMRGRGDGTFESPQALAGGGQVLGVVAADMNRDGRIDLVASDADDNTVSVFLNDCTPQ
jgi:hypothetical protein